jgi:Tfp pilus assembly protein PilO
MVWYVLLSLLCVGIGYWAGWSDAKAERKEEKEEDEKPE